MRDVCMLAWLRILDCTCPPNQIHSIKIHHSWRHREKTEISRDTYFILCSSSARSSFSSPSSSSKSERSLPRNIRRMLTGRPPSRPPDTLISSALSFLAFCSSFKPWTQHKHRLIRRKKKCSLFPLTSPKKLGMVGRHNFFFLINFFHFCYFYLTTGWKSKLNTIILMNCQQNGNTLKKISKLGLIRIFFWNWAEKNFRVGMKN